VSRLAWVAALALAGCAVPLGPVGALVPESETVGVKLLRPDVVGRSCGWTALGMRLAGEAPTLRAAMAQILALDAEGDVVTEAKVERERFVTVLYNRECLVVRGNLARVVSTLTIPAPPGHQGHHAP
jgi:hypothetical protein